jgi:hypothetical protein
MFPDGWQHPTLRSLRFLDPALLAAALALGACSGADNPVAPTPAVPVAEAPAEAASAAICISRCVSMAKKRPGRGPQGGGAD